MRVFHGQPLLFRVEVTVHAFDLIADAVVFSANTVTSVPKVRNVPQARSNRGRFPGLTLDRLVAPPVKFGGNGAKPPSRSPQVEHGPDGGLLVFFPGDQDYMVLTALQLTAFQNKRFLVDHDGSVIGVHHEPVVTERRYGRPEAVADKHPQAASHILRQLHEKLAVLVSGDVAEQTVAHVTVTADGFGGAHDAHAGAGQRPFLNHEVVRVDAGETR